MSADVQTAMATKRRRRHQPGVEASISGSGLRRLPSVDEVLRSETGQGVSERFGREATVAAVRRALAATRDALRDGDGGPATAAALGAAALARLVADDVPNLRPVYNLTGTVLHTNLGRACLAEAAVEAAVQAMRSPVALEYDLATGRRGERDDLVRDLLIGLTGAEDATVVNNGAAALMLALNTLARNQETVVSRGELIEIGGAFRLPELMEQAGTRLREVGTTNRTHPRDYRNAIGPATALLLKVHTSNFLIQGFTAEVAPATLSGIARQANLPLVHDLGSGTLVDLRRFGLGHEPTVREAVEVGADLITFSGDKLLGGPQAGFVVGRRDLVARINANPLKRALRVDKMRLAALEATLRLYRDPDRLVERLPTLRALARPADAIRAVAERVRSTVATAVGSDFTVAVVDTTSQIGSGALPLTTLPSAALAIRPAAAGGGSLDALAAALRSLPVAVIGRIEGGALRLDCRCLDDPDIFARDVAVLGGRIGA